MANLCDEGRKGGIGQVAEAFNIPQLSFQGSILRIEQSVVLNRGHLDIKQMINVHLQTNTRNQLPIFASSNQRPLGTIFLELDAINMR
jgi:hypothetical protein